MPEFRLVRQFGTHIRPTDSKVYRVETVELLTEGEAFRLMRELDSPYVGSKYVAQPGVADSTCPIMTPKLSRKDKPVIKKITTLVSENKKNVARKVVFIGGIALGLVATALLTRSEEETVLIVGETVEEEDLTTDETKPES